MNFFFQMGEMAAIEEIMISSIYRFEKLVYCMLILFAAAPFEWEIIRLETILCLESMNDRVK